MEGKSWAKPFRGFPQLQIFAKGLRAFQHTTGFLCLVGWVGLLQVVIHLLFSWPEDSCHSLSPPVLLAIPDSCSLQGPTAHLQSRHRHRRAVPHSSAEAWSPPRTMTGFKTPFPELASRHAPNAFSATLVQLPSCALHSSRMESWFFSGNGWHFPGPVITCLEGFYSHMKASSGQGSLADMLGLQFHQTQHRRTTTGAMLYIPSHLQHLRHIRVSQRSPLCFQQVNWSLQDLNAELALRTLRKWGNFNAII